MRLTKQSAKHTPYRRPGQKFQCWCTLCKGNKHVGYETRRQYLTEDEKWLAYEKDDRMRSFLKDAVDLNHSQIMEDLEDEAARELALRTLGSSADTATYTSTPTSTPTPMTMSTPTPTPMSTPAPIPIPTPISTPTSTATSNLPEGIDDSEELTIDTHHLPVSRLSESEALDSHYSEYDSCEYQSLLEEGEDDTLNQDSQHSGENMTENSAASPETITEKYLTRIFAPTVADAINRQPVPLTSELACTLRYWLGWAKGNGTVHSFSTGRERFMPSEGWPEHSPPVPETLYKAIQLVHALTGLETREVDMCINACMAFTGDYARLMRCCAQRDGHIRSEERFDQLERPKRRFTWMPVLPRIRPDHERGRMTSYFKDAVNRVRETRGQPGHIYRNFTDGEVIASYHRVGLNECDESEYIYLSLDGAQWQGGQPSDSWLILATRLNLPPEERFKELINLLIALAPGPLAPVHLSFLFTGNC